MDFCFAKSRNPPARAIASSTVAELLITIRARLIYLAQDVEFLAVDLLNDDRDFRFRNVVLQSGGNFLLQFQRSAAGGLNFSNQRQRDLSIRPYRDGPRYVWLFPHIDCQDVVIANYEAVVVRLRCRSLAFCAG